MYKQIELYLSIGIIILSLFIIFFEYYYNISEYLYDVNHEEGSGLDYTLVLLGPRQYGINYATKLLAYRTYYGFPIFTVFFTDGSSKTFSNAHWSGEAMQQKDSKGYVLFSFNKFNGKLDLWQNNQMITYEAAISTSGSNPASIGSEYIPEDARWRQP